MSVATSQASSSSGVAPASPCVVIDSSASMAISRVLSAEAWRCVVGSAPIISAATSRMMPMEAEILQPDRIAGMAPGRMILRTMDHQDRPKDWPMRTRVRSTLSTPP